MKRYEPTRREKPQPKRVEKKGEAAKPRRTRKTRRPRVGAICAAVVALISLIFFVVVWRTGLVPGKWLVLLFMVLGVVVVADMALLLDYRKKARFIPGAVLGVLLSVVLLVGGVVILQGVAALNRITTAEDQIQNIGVYVMKDDQAQILEDAEDYTFGILSTMDQEIAQKATDALEDAFKKDVDPVGFKTLPDLLDGLYDGQVEAIIFPDSFFSILNEMEGYADAQERIRALQTMEFKKETSQLQKPQMPDHTFTVYMSGIDSRTGLDTYSRSDVNILAHVNTKTKQVLLVSTPRDYYVPLSISGGIRDKLTHAGVYGVEVSVETMEMLYDMDIDYFFRVNFGGFVEIINALGGITVESEHAFYSDVSGGHWFDQGTNYLDGDAALAFARERYNLEGGDVQRGRNQMAVIRGALNKVMSPEILARYTDVLSAVEGNFETTIPYELIAQLVRDQLSKGGDWEIMMYNVSGTGDMQQPYSLSMEAYVMWPDESTVEAVKTAIAQMDDNERISLSN